MLGTCWVQWMQQTHERVSEILAHPKHYQSSWISTLAAAAADKTTTSVSTLHYKSCESPC